MTHPAPKMRKSREELIENALETAAREAAIDVLSNLWMARHPFHPPKTREMYLEEAGEAAADLCGFTAILNVLEAKEFLGIAIATNTEYSLVLSHALALIEDGGSDAAAPERAAVITDDEARGGRHG
ncbi:MAG: hypothetical protein VB101_07140 [Rhodospirillaceae bacterium]|nr:hypothetical protein [Rhodospirillaceae bacterium]